MSIIAEKTQSERTLAPQGNHVARCYQMIHIGTIDTEYMGEKKQVNKVNITWELPNELNVFKEENGPEPFVISKEYTLSMGEKANLRKDLESWRGKGFSEQEADAFDITKLLGVPCMINIIHKTSKAGNDYAIVSGITPLPKGLECPSQINDSFEFNYGDKFDALNKLNDWIKDKVKTSKEYQEKMNPNQHSEQSNDDEDDGLPF